MGSATGVSELGRGCVKTRREQTRAQLNSLSKNKVNFHLNLQSYTYIDRFKILMTLRLALVLAPS